MTQSNASSPRELEVPFKSQTRERQLKCPRMKRFLEEGRMEEKRSRFYHPLEKSE